MEEHGGNLDVAQALWSNFETRFQQVDVSLNVKTLDIVESPLAERLLCLTEAEPCQVVRRYGKRVRDCQTVVDGNKAVLVVLFLDQNVAGISVKIHQTEIQDCNLMYFIFAEEVRREVFDRAFTFDELLEGTDLDLGGLFVLFLGHFGASGGRANVKVLRFGCIQIFK